MFLSHFSSNRVPKSDQSTFEGYLVSLMIGFIPGLIYIVYTATLNALFVSMGFYFRAFYSHYESMFRNMNELVDGTAPEGAKQIQLKASLIEAIKLREQTKE